MTLLAESYSKFFDFPEGQIGVMADLNILGDVVEILELSIYPIGAEYIPIGTAKLRTIYREIASDVREAGYKRLRITGGRLTGASRGRRVDIGRKV